MWVPMQSVNFGWQFIHKSLVKIFMQMICHNVHLGDCISINHVIMLIYVPIDQKIICQINFRLPINTNMS